MAGLPSPSYKVVLRGTLRGSQPWSTAFWVTLTGGSSPTQNNITTDSGSFGALISTLWTAIATHIAVADRLEEVALYYYPNGSLVATLVGIDTAVSAPGAGSSLVLPSQLCQVVSLRSALIGRSGRGRMYFPYSDASGLTAGQVQASGCSDYSDNVALMMTALNGSTTAAGSSIQCVIASFTKSLTHPIVTTIANSKLETQRRREDKILVAHTTSHVV
jgi:hypothetical protein